MAISELIAKSGCSLLFIPKLIAVKLSEPAFAHLACQASFKLKFDSSVEAIIVYSFAGITFNLFFSSLYSYPQ